MPILTKLKQHLEEHGVEYEVLTHVPAYTAQRVAEAQHVAGRELAKVVIAKADDRFVMAVLPAPSRLDLAKLASAAGARTARLATEREFAKCFPRCEPGAMPPFGNLFAMPVFADATLAADERIVFQAGTHTDTVRLRYADFAGLVRPWVGDLTLRREEAA